MDQKTFLTGIAMLSFLPPEKVREAVLIAENLTDEDREEIFAKLHELDGRLAKTDQEDEAAVTQLEEIVAEGERRLAALEHGEEEAGERAQSVSAVEDQLSAQS
ncbi:MAG: hypothetical protein PHE68_04250 [Candidatus Peribacteraceae bacterium]|nr:hypothetical protein [Candidatus Peribacteraceae bacterium]MDD5074670.1 hypothetical protein [Candidatus Peribacteraceae bacterium]